MTDNLNWAPPRKYHNQVGEDDVFMVSMSPAWTFFFSLIM